MSRSPTPSPLSPTPIRSKRDFYPRYTAGEFGNKLRTWDSPEEVPASFNGRLMLRPINGRGGSMPTHELPVKQALAYWRKHPAYSANETAPDHLATLQGEIYRDAEGLNFYGRERRPEELGISLRMRDILRTAVQYRGLTATLLLRKHLYPGSLADVESLMNLYPDHVIEFAAYGTSVGNLLNRNTIIWEVRAY